MAPRAQLRDILRGFTPNVYFQPPPSVEMIYPAIVYHRSSGDTQFADNNPYTHCVQYSVIVIDSDPDSEIPNKVAMLPMCIRDRSYTVDNLNHDAFNIYF